jgi:hypothetical protein
VLRYAAGKRSGSRRELKTTISARLVLALCVFVVLNPAAVSAQTAALASAPALQPPPPILGTIVSVRGSIYQLSQRYLKGVSRFLATGETNILDRQNAQPSVLAPGMNVIGYGEKGSNGIVAISQLRASKSPTAFSRWGSHIGLQPDPEDGPDWVTFGGTLKSLKPFTVIDDNKTIVPAKLSIDKLKSVDLWIQATPAQLMIGRKAFVIGSRRSSDILLATQIFLLNSPGNPGTMFGQILSIGKGRIIVMPRFGVDPVTISYGSTMKVERQISVDPSTIKLGQTITVWGGHSADSNDLSQLTAYVIMPGIGHFPASVDATPDDPTSTGRDIIGRVIGYEPLTIKTKTGKQFIVSVPGQTPTARYAPGTLADLHAGQQAMLICAVKSAGSNSLTAQTVVIDASPVVAMGF